MSSWDSGLNVHSASVSIEEGREGGIVLKFAMTLVKRDDQSLYGHHHRRRCTESFVRCPRGLMIDMSPTTPGLKGISSQTMNSK
eukprot:scaffold596_cov87-Cylindrotheca_fusiformis.AAC.9